MNEFTRDLSQHQANDLMIYGVPQQAIDLINYYRNNGYPNAFIHIPLHEKYDKIFKNERNEQHTILYYFVLDENTKQDDLDHGLVNRSGFIQVAQTKNPRV